MALLYADNILPQASNSVSVHATIADPGLWPEINAKGQLKGHSAVQLFYLARGLDKSGTGAVIIDLQQAAAILQTSIYSIRRRINWGLNLGLFRDKIRAGVGKVKIFYSSIQKICTRLNLADIGAITEIDINHLKDIKFAATEATALQLQKRSRWRETHRKKVDRRRTLDPEQLTSSDLCNGPILTKYGRLTFLKRSTASYGGSQKRIAWEQGRHISTVQRRLSDGYREQHNLLPVPKTQLATAPDYFTLHSAPGRPAIKKLVPGQRLIKIPRLGLFKLGCNVYNLPDNLQPKRLLRVKVTRAINRQINQELVGNDWKANPEYIAYKAALRAINDKHRLSSEKIAPPRNIPES